MDERQAEDQVGLAALLEPAALEAAPAPCRRGVGEVHDERQDALVALRAKVSVERLDGRVVAVDRDDVGARARRRFASSARRCSRGPRPGDGRTERRLRGRTGPCARARPPRSGRARRSRTRPSPRCSQSSLRTSRSRPAALASIISLRKPALADLGPGVAIALAALEASVERDVGEDAAAEECGDREGSRGPAAGSMPSSEPRSQRLERRGRRRPGASADRERGSRTGDSRPTARPREGARTSRRR